MVPLSALLKMPSRPRSRRPVSGSQYDFNALDNVLLTPHSSAHTYDADEGRYVSIAKSLREYAQGQTPKRLVATGTGENLGDFKLP